MILLESREIHLNDIYNFDETGFQIGIGKAEKSLYKGPKKHTIIASQSSCKSVTIIECISSNGFLLPLLIILPGKHQLVDWYRKTKIPDQYIIQTSKNGYINDKIGYHWIYYFDTFTKDCTTRKYRLLLIFPLHAIAPSGRKSPFRMANDRSLCPRKKRHYGPLHPDWSYPPSREYACNSVWSDPPDG